MWFQPQAAEFAALMPQLLPYAQVGDFNCQHALATIFGFGYCYPTEAAFLQDNPYEKDSYWWAQAAAQGHWFALDNLITSGVGEEAERVRKLAREFEEKHPEKVRWSSGVGMPIPIYDFYFMQQLCEFIYGRVILDLK